MSTMKLHESLSHELNVSHMDHMNPMDNVVHGNVNNLNHRSNVGICTTHQPHAKLRSGQGFFL